MSGDLIKRLLAEETDLTDCAVDRIEQLERENAEIDQPFFNLYAEAFTRIKSVVDGKSEQSIKAIVYELLDAFSAMGVKK